MQRLYNCKFKSHNSDEGLMLKIVYSLDFSDRLCVKTTHEGVVFNS